MKVYLFQVYFFNLNFVPKTTPFVLIFDRTFHRYCQLYFFDFWAQLSVVEDSTVPKLLRPKALKRDNLKVQDNRNHFDMYLDS